MPKRQTGRKVMHFLQAQIIFWKWLQLSESATWAQTSGLHYYLAQIQFFFFFFFSSKEKRRTRSHLLCVGCLELFSWLCSGKRTTWLQSPGMRISWECLLDPKRLCQKLSSCGMLLALWKHQRISHLKGQHCRQKCSRSWPLETGTLMCRMG